mgnify:CR=1 FL=1
MLCNSLLKNTLHLGCFSFHIPLMKYSRKRPAPKTNSSFRRGCFVLVGMNKHSNRHAPNGSASCVQRFDDSLDFAIRMTYRISLRSSSLWEPRHPLLKVLISFHRIETPSYWYHDEFQSECLVYHTCKQADFRRIQC